MKKRLLKYLLIVPIFMMLPLSAYSLFYFETTKDETTIDTDVRIDDIAENYTFASSTKVDMPTYDIYFFPSLLYMDTSIFGEKPEEYDGYLLADNNGGGLTRVGNTNNDYYDRSLAIGSRSTAPNYYVNSYNDRNDPDTIYGKSWEINGRDYGVVDEEKINSQYNNYGEGRYPRNMYRQERFGYWPNKNLDDGRFLPIKFEGVEQLSSYLYNQYIVDPLCSMNDPGNYYVYYFAGWTYKLLNGEMPVDQEDGYSLIQSMFRNSDNQCIFDILENPANYADDDGVIRLYPYFVGEGTYDFYANNDSTRINIKVNDDRDIKRFVFTGETHENITYTTGGWFDENHVISNISLAVSYNVQLDSNKKISIHWMKKDDYSGNEWNNNVFEIPSEDIVKLYGQGLYNFYIAVGYNGQNCSVRERNIDLDEFYNKLSFNNFDSISAKNIIKYNKAYGDSGDGLHSSHGHMGNNRAPLVIGFEKVTDIKIIEGIDTSGNYNDYIESVYPSSANFSHTNLVNMPYAYLVRNIDLSDDVNKSFQLRFGEYYISGISFNEPTDSILVPIEQGSSTTQEFVPYADYFSLSNINGQNFFSVKSELYYHIFDFLLIYENGSFSFYVYRHTDFFVKLYGSDITLDHDAETGMVLHSNIPSIWENRYGASQEINSSDVNTNSDIHGSFSIENTIRNHIVTLENNTLSEYVLLDHVTQSIVGYFDENDNFIFRSFIVNKNYILELHYIPDLIKSLSLD